MAIIKIIIIKRFIIEVELSSRNSLLMRLLCPLRISSRLISLLMSGVRIALALFLATVGFLAGLVPAQIPTKIELSSMSLIINGYDC